MRLSVKTRAIIALQVRSAASRIAVEAVTGVPTNVWVNRYFPHIDWAGGVDRTVIQVRRGNGHFGAWFQP